MRAMMCATLGAPDGLVLREVPTPPVGPGEVGIDVHAAGVNFPDLLMIAGTYQERPPLPFIPGFEVAGVVRETGVDGTAFSPGQQVMATVPYGGYAEQVTAPTTNVFVVPDGLALAAAAAVPIAYGTAYHALVDRAGLRSGETLLVTGAAGGVGLAAVQLGKRLGATVIGVVGSPHKAQIARAHGADHVIDYAALREEVRELTDGRGADVIFDPVGGDAFDQSMRAIAWGGRLLVIGFASGRIPELPVNLALLKGGSVVGVFWGSFAEREPAANHRNFAQLAEWMSTGEIRPHISMTAPLEQAATALQALADRRATGKVVLEVR